MYDKTVAWIGKFEIVDHTGPNCEDSWIYRGRYFIRVGTNHFSELGYNWYLTRSGSISDSCYHSWFNELSSAVDAVSRYISRVENGESKSDLDMMRNFDAS